MLQPIQYNANSERATEMFDGEAAIAISGYAGHASTDAELAQYGLLDPKAHIFAEGVDTEGNAYSFEIWLGNADGDVTYARIDDSGDIYTVETSLLSFLSNARTMYLVDQFTNLVNIAKIDSVTIATPDTSYYLNIERTPVTGDDGEDDTQETYYFDNTLTTEDLFKDFYQVLIGALSDKACDDPNYQGNVVCSVTYDVNIEGVDDFTVEYLDYNKDYYAVRRDGKTYFLIRRASVDSILEACVQYRAGEYVGDGD
jgi:hypothetical protein